MSEDAMDCDKSITLLSEFHDGALDETTLVLVRLHLDGCPPCAEIYLELSVIVVAASSLRSEGVATYPDESVLWQRMRLTDAAAGEQVMKPPT